MLPVYNALGMLRVAYLQCASCMATSADVDRVKSSGRLMVKGILAKIKVNNELDHIFVGNFMSLYVAILCRTFGHNIQTPFAV